MKRKPVHIETTDEEYDNGGWISHTFTVNRAHYFLPHTPYAPFWELMEDKDEEFVTIAVGPDACKQWLASHGIHGVVSSQSIAHIERI